MLGIYYGNGWGAKSLPFMSTKLLMSNGTAYPVADVFVDGVLDESQLLKYGLPKLTGTFAFAMFMANAAVSTKSPDVHASVHKLTILHFLDRCSHRSLHPLLGQGYCCRV